MRKKTLLTLMISLIAVVIGAYYISGTGNKDLVPATGYEVTEAGAQTNLNTVTLDVPSMHCVSCPVMVEKTLMKVSGVQKVTANLETKTAKIVYDKEKTSPGELVDALKNDIGYESKIHGN